MTNDNNLFDGGEPINMVRCVPGRSTIVDTLDSMTMRLIDDTPTLGVYYMNKDVMHITKATAGSACYDVYAHMPMQSLVKGYNGKNGKLLHKSSDLIMWSTESENDIGIALNPGDRVLIPTGIILNIPEQYSVHVYSRSGIAHKRGLMVTNGIGIIDSDFINELHILLVNTSNNRSYVWHNERIAQIELVRNRDYNVSILHDAPGQKTDRVGGFGHTGTR